MPFETQFYLSAIDHLKDPARTTRWRLLLPGAIFKATGYTNTNKDSLFKDTEDATDDFALQVKTCKIPNIDLTQEAHEYMGFKSFFPVRAKIDADFPFQAILLEDIRGYEAVLAWHQACINTGLLKRSAETPVDDFTTESGINLGLGHHKDPVDTLIIRNNTIKVEMYNWMTGAVILTLRMINAVPREVAGWELTYGEGPLAKFNFTLHADRWEVIVSEDGGASNI